MKRDSVYIYGIVDGRVDRVINIPGIGGGEVYCVPFKELTAIVSNTLFREYDPNEENTLAHERIIQEILGLGLTIAPMRFCTILKSKGDLRKLMHSAYLPFRRNILQIRDKLELGVKVFLDIEKMKSEIGDDGLAERSREIAGELNDRLRQMAESGVLDELFTDEMILNASFLVHKDRVKGFYDEIYAFDKQFTDKLKIRISGPTAPYNFVSLPVR